MKRPAGLAVAALVATAVVAAAPASAATFFETPSHNIGCAISKSVARCDIRVRAWEPPPKPARCPVDWGNGLTVARRGFAHPVCAGDTVFGGQRVLGYRKSIRRGRFECTSRRDGVRCVNLRSEHGFKLGRRSARWF
ncbi:MAG: hypothetical protein H0T69_14305 [Thermoleophilaceae bacterium]|nr:hypothetical protein [Thermoleophilaceae bacterium]